MVIESPKEKQDHHLFTQASALIWRLEKTGFGHDIDKFSSFPGLQPRADEIAQRAAQWSPSNDSLMSILQTPAASDPEFELAGGSPKIFLSRS